MGRRRLVGIDYTSDRGCLGKIYAVIDLDMTIENNWLNTRNMKSIIKKYQDIILYLFFGVCTTIANIGSYAFCTRILHWGTVFSTTVAWLIAVTLAYITNRQWVFHSTAKGYKDVAKEIASFFACRTATGIMDILIMYIFVTVFHFPDIILKAISNILVIILNYIASKLVIFK